MLLSQSKNSELYRHGKIEYAKDGLILISENNKHTIPIGDSTMRLLMSLRDCSLVNNEHIFIFDKNKLKKMYPECLI